MERNLLHNGKTFIFVHPHSLWGLSITNKALFPDSGNKAFILRSVKVASILKIRDKARMLIALLSAISILAKWCQQESNRGHKDFQSFALPTELWHHHVVLYIVVSITGAKVGIIFNPANVLKEKFTGQ